MFQLVTGHVIRRRIGTHLVNGVPVRSFRSEPDKVIDITDDGDPDELVRRTAEAVEDAYRATGRSVPIISENEAHRLPFRPPPFQA